MILNLNKNYKELYKDIREQSKIRDYRNGMLAGYFLTRDIGRLCSVLFIKYSITPNQITLFMILFGIVGSVLFAIPNTWCKIIGYMGWIMWFAMDCSDGQVARYTKTFSKYGTEMDYMAHLIDHPCMNLAILITFLQMNVVSPILLCFLFIINISVESIMRNITAFDYFHNKIYASSNNTKKRKQSLIKYIITQSTLYPTMIVCFSWIIIIGYAFNSICILYLFICWLLFYVILSTNTIITHLIKYYKST